MYWLIQIKEHFMIIIEKKFFLIKIKCQRKKWNSIVLVSIFSHIFQQNVIQILLINKEDFIKFIDKYLKK
jgi:hypothetical protein